MVVSYITKQVKFLDFTGQWIILKMGTEVLVDTNESIACWQDHCFDIGQDEYSIIN